MRTRPRGFSLVNTLLCTAVLVALAFTAASLTVSQLTLTSQLENNKIAHDLAESAASYSLAQISLDPKWTGDSEIRLATAPGGWGRVTYDKLKAAQWKVLPSTNNLSETTAGASQADDSIALPAASIQIIATGQYRGITVKINQIIAIPPFKYALSSSGTIRSTGGLLVASIDNPKALAFGLDSLPDEYLKAGHLAGNREGADSVVLNSSVSRPVLIKGGVDSAGKVLLTGGAKVVGGVRENAQPVPLPQIEVKDYDPRDRPDAVNYEEPVQDQFVISKPTRQKGNLKVTNGLNLTKGYLYVDGNLDIYGGLKGKGAIFATGNVTVHDVSTYGANDQEAIVAQGDISIQGSGRDHSIFQGVLYTEGDFHAEDVTLVGSLVANKSGGSQMELDTCNVLYNAQLMQSKWNSGFEVDAGNFKGNDALEFAPSDFLTFGNNKGEKASLTVSKNPKAKNFYDANIDQYTLEMGKKNPYMTITVPTLDGSKLEFSSWDDLISTLSNPNHGLPVHYEGMGGSRDTWDPLVIDQMKRAKNKSIEYGQGDNQRNYDDLLADKVVDFNNYYIRTRAAWMGQGEFSFSVNPNQFIQLTDKARRMMWTDE